MDSKTEFTSTLDDYRVDVPEENEFESKRCCTKRNVWEFVKKNLILFLLVLALFLGIGLGAGLRAVQPPFDDRQLMYLRFPGDLLMNMLMLLILPLIVSSLVSGLAGLDTRASGRLGLRAVVYYMTTTLTAVITGIVLVIAIGPGYRGGEAGEASTFKKVHPADTFLDLIRQCFPDNLIEACFQKPLTQLVEKKTEDTQDDTNTTTTAMTSAMTTVMTTVSANETNATAPEPILIPEVTKVPGMNVLGLVVFSIALGIIIGRMKEKGKPLKDLFDSLCEATMKLIYLVIWYSPVGVMFLIAHKVVEMDDPVKMFEQLLFYFITVLAGLGVHGFITLPLVFLVIVRKNPYRFMQGILQAMITAVATSSSSATLPVTMQCLEENNGVDPRITKFVAPVGATINMDGTALYEAVAVIFIGQIRNFPLDVGNIITISLTATAAAIGAAGVPQAGLVTMVIVLTAVGFPTDDVTLILAVDWLLDRFRTMINVVGDAYGAGIVGHLSRGDIAKLDALDKEEEEMTVIAEAPNGHINSAFESERL